ncbi:MAG: radical SAM protein, partial [Lachnospiraceae bacterium]|nr:radical SAM protein [Lachnospiraceae bacterium]
MIFSETTSVCPVCLKTLPAILRTAPDGVYMDKTCPDHGNFSALLWEGDFESYLAWPSGNESREVPINGCQTKKGCPYDCGLCEE